MLKGINIKLNKWEHRNAKLIASKSYLASEPMGINQVFSVLLRNKKIQQKARNVNYRIGQSPSTYCRGERDKVVTVYLDDDLTTFLNKVAKNSKHARTGKSGTVSDVLRALLHNYYIEYKVKQLWHFYENPSHRKAMKKYREKQRRND